MEKIKAKVEGILHKDHSTSNTTATHTGAAGTHTGTTGTHASTHAGYTGDELHGNPTHVGQTGHAGGLTGSTAHGTHGQTTGLTGTHNTHSDPTGPHDSKFANKLDPRVDSDQVGGHGNAASAGGPGHATHAGTHTGTHTGGLTGNTYGSDPTGPHDSRLANKADPRVDADYIGGYGNTTGVGDHGTTHAGHTGTHAGHIGGGLTGNAYGSDPTGPRNSHLANKTDPRVDSHHVGGYDNATGAGGYGTTHTGHTGAPGSHGLTGQGSHLPGPASGTAGPHKSDLLNRADPRVDADLDGSKTYGGNKTYGN